MLILPEYKKDSLNIRNLDINNPLLLKADLVFDGVDFVRKPDVITKTGSLSLTKGHFLNRIFSSSNYIIVPYSVDSGDWTIAGVFKVNSFGTPSGNDQCAIVGSCNDAFSSVRDRSLGYSDANKCWQGYIYDGTTTLVNSNKSVRLGQYQTVVLTCKANELTIYVGSSVTSISTSNTGYTTYSTPKFSIGAADDGALNAINIALLLKTRRFWSLKESKSFLTNPWQIFEPESVPFDFNTGTSGVSGSLTWAEGNETSALTGSLSNSLSGAWTEANETSALTVALSQSASLSWTEANETTAITGSVTDGQAASLAWTEANETTAITAASSATASLAWAEASETLSITAEQAQDTDITLAWAEQGETCLISVTPEMSEIEKPFWLFYSLYQTEPEPQKPIKRIVKRQIKKLLDDVVEELIDKAEKHEKQRLIKSINEMKVAKLLETSKAEARKIIKEQIQKRLEYEDDEDVIFLLTHMY